MTNPNLKGVEISEHQEISRIPNVESVEFADGVAVTNNPILSGVEISYTYPQKLHVLTHMGLTLLLRDSQKLASTQDGYAINLNPNNPNNTFYQII